MKYLVVGGCMLAFFGCIELGAPTGNEVPREWRHIWLIEKDYDEGPLAAQCGDGTTPVRSYHTLSKDWGCSTCDCSFTGAVCTAPGYSCNVNKGTLCTPVETNKPVSEGCADIAAGSSVNAACQLTSLPEVLDSGQCEGNPSGAVGDIWMKMVLTCSATTDTCMDESCFTPPTGELKSALLCITQQGEVDCPEDWSNYVKTVYSGADDGRSCGSCECDTSSITCTGGSITFFDAQNCDPASPRIDLTALDVCTQVDGFLDGSGASVQVEVGTPGSGTCSQPSGSTGAATPTGPRTICCK